MPPFHLKAIDHVAIRSFDLEATINWYQNVLGLEVVQPEEWKPFPVFLMKDNFGIAVFPATKREKLRRENTVIDHFAFTVSVEDLKEAQVWLKEQEVEVRFKDHLYYHSLYLNDPDGHIVELTAMVKSMK